MIWLANSKVLNRSNSMYRFNLDQMLRRIKTRLKNKSTKYAVNNTKLAKLAICKPHNFKQKLSQVLYLFKIKLKTAINICQMIQNCQVKNGWLVSQDSYGETKPHQSPIFRHFLQAIKSSHCLAELGAVLKEWKWRMNVYFMNENRC